MWNEGQLEIVRSRIKEIYRTRSGIRRHLKPITRTRRKGDHQIWNQRALETAKRKGCIVQDQSVVAMMRSRAKENWNIVSGSERSRHETHKVKT